MKISLNWLQEYLPGSLDRETAAEALTYGGLPVENFEQIGDDTIIDVEVTSNRSDCLSHIGVARELSALLNRDFRDVPGARASSPAFGAEERARTPAPSDPAVSVSIEAGDLCPHYTGQIIQNIKIGPSPAWLTRRLEAVGVRPINNVVDVTNYVLFEMGQPLHAFDFDKIEGRRVIVRRAGKGEKLVTIDGRERELNPEMLVIADAVRPVALAGVMGGRDSEVSERTVNILLESARFDPLSIRKTARRLAMGSDSSYRFERGIDPQLPLRASKRAAELILQIAGGKSIGGLAEAGASGWKPKMLPLRLARLKQVLGIDLPTSEVVDALRRDHLEPVLRDHHVECSIPSYRLDLNIEVDLIEEVARIAGYDKVPVREEISIRLTQADPAAAAIEAIRSTLVAGGYFESVTFSFVSDALAQDFIPTQACKNNPLMRAEHSVRKADANLRPSILPGLLESIRHNESAGVPEPRLFEIGSVFWNQRVGSRESGAGSKIPTPHAPLSTPHPLERRCVALVGASTVSDVRGVIETMLARLNSTRAIKIIPDARPGFAPGACGRIEWGGQAVGFLGKIDRAVAEKLSLREIPAGAELELDPLLAGMLRTPQLTPLPKFPPIRRDLSLVVPEPVRFEKIETLIRDQKAPNMQELQYVTTYRGKPLEKGQKSVTVTLVFRSPTETLTSDAVEASMQRVVEAAKKQGWSQRI